MVNQKYYIEDPIKTVLFEVDGNWVPYSAIITKKKIKIPENREFTSAIDYYLKKY